MEIANSILPIIILLALGYFIKRLWIKDSAFWKNINNLIYYIMFPALMVKSIGLADFSSIKFDFIYILILIIFTLVGVIWSLKALFKDERFWVVFIQGAVRYNSYIFISVTFFYVGEGAISMIALITAFLVMTTNVISVVIMNIYSPHKKNLLAVIKSTLTNPLILSCIFGLFINYIGLFVPYILKITWLNEFLGHLGRASLVLSLIAIGSTLKFDVLGAHFKGIFLCALIKLVVLPLIVVTTLIYLEYNPVLALVCMLYAGSPCSSNATAMTQAMGGDYKSMSMIISVQTLLSLITIPTLLYIHAYYFPDIIKAL